MDKHTLGDDGFKFNDGTIIDADQILIIDPITRTISNQTGVIKTIMQYDHNSEAIMFKIPRFVEGHDMFSVDSVRIHFTNEGESGSNSGVYEIPWSRRVIEGESEFVVFGWLISQNVTRIAGNVSFQIRFSCYEKDNRSVIDYMWSTREFSGIEVLPSVDNSGAVVEMYADILEQWKNNIIPNHGILSQSARDILLTILQDAVYTCDQNANINALRYALEKNVANDDGINHIHVYGEWIDDGPDHVKVCECGDVIREEHVWDDGTIMVDPTPTEPGELMHICLVCGTTVSTYLPPTGE